MSTRLDLALHEIADAVGDASAFGDGTAPHTVATVRRLTGRVRRRRAARGVGTAAVAASAAGAVAVIGPQLAIDPPPAAAPGTCGAPAAGPASATGRTGFSIRPDGVDDLAEDGTGTFGTWQGQQLSVQVETDLAPTEPPTALPTAPDLVITEGATVVAEGVLAPPVAVVDAGAAWGTSPDGTASAEAPVWRRTTADGQLAVGWTSVVDLVSCATGERLAPGAYDVWATQVGSDDVTRTVGPFDLTLAPVQPSVTASLPDGFPVDVPLVGGRLVSAGRDGAGWTAEVATPGTDRENVARTLLAGGADLREDGTSDALRTAPDGGVVVDGWSVLVSASLTAGGDPSVTYALTPDR